VNDTEKAIEVLRKNYIRILEKDLLTI